MDKKSTDYSHTCITCRVAFVRAEMQRDHYKSDWHRYNLKRKVAELPSVSAEVFQQKVIEMKSNVDVPELENQRCLACNKSFQSAAAFENHCNSKKHLELLKKQPIISDEQQPNKAAGKTETVKELEVNDITVPKTSESQDDSDEEWEGEGLSMEECLFCSTASANLDENLKHMSIGHGFFIPDLEFCIDVEGLITYLGEKVGVGNVCLWCNERGKSFHSLDAVQKHMRDKGHCKMLHDGEAMLEYSEYFDYSSSYPDADRANDEDVNDQVDLPVVEERDWQLVLPSGATIGHRSLMRYYRQNLKADTQISLSTKRQAVHRLLGQYRALGWTGTTGIEAQRKARDLRFMKKLQAKHHMQVGIKANKLYIKRSQIGF